MAEQVHHGVEEPLRSRPAIAVATTSTLCVLIVVAILSLSDRVPAMLEPAAGRVHLDGFVRDGVFGLEFDTIGHGAVWAAVTLAACLAIGRRRSPILVAATAIGASVVMEVLQATTTDSRAFERLDLAGNTLGIAVAAASVMATRALHRGLRTSATATT